MHSGRQIQWIHRQANGEGFGSNGLTVGYIGDPDADRVVLLVSMLHGDEDPGVLVIHELLNQLDVLWSPTGLVKVIPISNPDASLAGSRVSPLDRLDANRISGGDPDGQISERLVAIICDEAADASLFVAIHSFETATPMAGIFTDPPDTATRSDALRALAALRPSYVLAVPFTPLHASLDGTLNDAGIASVSIELGRIDLLGERDVELAAHGLMRALELHGVAELHAPLAASNDGPLPTCYRRSTVRAGRLGIWLPDHGVGSRVLSGQPLGTVCHLPTFEREKITAPNIGDINIAEWTVLQVRPREVVRPNDILVGLGCEDPALTLELAQRAP